VRSDDLRGKQFSTHRLGYDKTEVEAFVEAAGLRLAAMESTTDRQERRLAVALSPAGPNGSSQRNFHVSPGLPARPGK
jgi:DivIVA domain-containing protein